MYQHDDHLSSENCPFFFPTIVPHPTISVSARPPENYLYNHIFSTFDLVMHQISWFAHARRLEFTWVIWYQLRRRLCQVIIANRIKNYFTYTNAESTIDRDSEKKVLQWRASWLFNWNFGRRQNKLELRNHYHIKVKFRKWCAYASL